MPNTTLKEDTNILSVSQLNMTASALLDEAFPPVWVTGELSNVSLPRSGHMYFSLKDDACQVRCAMFRRQNGALTFEPEEGMQVLLHAKVGLYTARGDFQLIVHHMEEAGDGKLQREFEKLKQKLDKEGLFLQANKKALPEHPKCIGVITSSTGAALHDILSVLARRAPMIPVIVYPSLVQGDDAPDQLIHAIKTANKRKECDVLILSRGGGSAEDLWPFNDEQLARTIFKSELPIISGVGHEVDVTIADFVADVRAPTPSAAAELISTDRMHALQRIQYLSERLQHLMTHRLSESRMTLNHLQARLKHPGERIQQSAQRLDDMDARLRTAITHHLAHANDHIRHLARALNAVSPLNTLARGYAIATQKDGKVLLDASATQVGELIHLKLSRSEVDCVVEKIK